MKNIKYILMFVQIFLIACSPNKSFIVIPTNTNDQLETVIDEIFYLGAKSFWERAPQYSGEQNIILKFLPEEVDQLLNQAKSENLREKINITGTPEDVFYQGMQAACERTPLFPESNSPSQYSIIQCRDMIQQARDLDLFGIINSLDPIPTLIPLIPNQQGL